MEFHWITTASIQARPTADSIPDKWTGTYDGVIDAERGATHQDLYQRICTELRSRIVKDVAGLGGVVEADADLRITFLKITPNELPAA